MKYLTKKTALLVLLISSLFSYAQADVHVEITNENLLQIQVQDARPHAQIYLTDKLGEVLYQSNITETHFKQFFNLVELPYGKYTLTFEDDKNYQSKVIVNQPKKLRIEKSQQFYKPNFRAVENTGDLIRVSFTNPSLKTTKLKVYDSRGNLVKTITDSAAYFNKVLDFSEVPDGEYSIAINTMGKAYYKTVNIHKN